MLNFNFKEWMVNLDEIRISGSADASSDDPARQYGRDQNPLVAKLMENKGIGKIRLSPHGGYDDVTLKIDGYFDSGEYMGKSVQISSRTAEAAKDDISYKLTSHPMQLNEILNVPIREIMAKNPGKASAVVDFHIIKTADDDILYMARDNDLKDTLERMLNSVEEYFTVDDLFVNKRQKGMYNKAARFNFGKNQIRIAGGNKGYNLIAFINLEENSFRKIEITKDDELKAKLEVESEQKEKDKKEKAIQQMKAQVPQGMSDLQFQQILKVIDGTLPYFTMQVSNNATKRKSIEQFLNRKPVTYTIEKNQMIIKKKV